MGEIILANAVERKPDCLYYIDKEGSICETRLSRTGRKRKIKEQTDGN